MAKLPNLPRTKSATEVPKLFREPDVHNGYRIPNQPITYYALSMFQVHNELLNVWTHVIAFSILLYRSLTFISQVDLSDPHAWPLLIFCTSCCMYVFLSSTAHLFQSQSELTHYTCFFMDYIGISLYGFSSGMVHFYYSAEESYIKFIGSGWFFFVVTLCLASFACFANGYPKVKYTRPYPYTRKLWQLGSVGSLYLWIIAPIFHHIIMCKSNSCTDEGIYYHEAQVFWFLIGAVFFALPYPQKIAPGWFDIVGHGHQFFHIFIPICTYSQMQAEYFDLVNRREIIEKYFEPSFMMTFGLTAVLLIVNFIILFWLRIKVVEKIKLKGE
ncbi:membrane progestin receptor beta-like [Saccoglossus kowalevskii]|uniref:Membrane progestin receptor beta-like n=1 Tax=Saccoglossus kowalevskii TaxID=10224 RepID=A0ABM0H023_SACKO|nr:PREDICTED: membrane progestin receptor beta-like [Saccoglossus kowalevskii]